MSANYIREGLQDAAAEVETIAGVKVFDSSDVFAFHTHVVGICADRTLGILSDGRMALVPAATEPGDVVAVIDRMVTPCVLRPLTDISTGDSYFQYLGECYAHNLNANASIHGDEGGLVGMSDYKDLTLL
jgi:hypothetical protein